MSDGFDPMSTDEARELERQWKAAHTGPAKFVPGPKKGGDAVRLFPWLVVCGAISVNVLLTKHEELKLRDAITAVEGDVLAIEHRLEQPSPVAAFINRRLDHLENRVFRPRFTKHAAGCPSCRGDAPSPEGGPSALCEEGFKLWQDDMRNEARSDSE